MKLLAGVPAIAELLMGSNVIAREPYLMRNLNLNTG